MASVNEQYPLRSVHSVRLNDHLVECAKETGIPISNIIESCLTNFVTLSDEDRIQLLVNNDPDKVEAEQVIKPKYNYADRAIEKAKESLGNKYSNRTSTKLLIALGLMLLVAFFSKNDS
ncbi:hypothetical protein [Desulfosporosinus hippei]|uniref:Uncharacterized protein n=1 Tax=Desulfosporosinus hippei DSM 8344 TaxID=1121419 RepID=A0A1G8CC83_9FIRM|nr:hypothetical protein [Desulfosporosinus hippei]SDH43018.1 hypothetical protein SAMN05443529_11358 [Desulfosporosinus hippei DSM 8344]